MKNSIRLLLLLLIFTGTFYAQQNIKGVTNEIGRNNDEIQSITEELSKARLSNNTEKQELLITRLRSLYGETRTDGVSEVTVIPGELSTDKGIINHEEVYVPLNSFLDGPNIKAIATQTTSRSNTIYAATTKFYDANYDRIHVFASYDDGLTWVLKGYSYLSARFRTGELDIEPIISGTDTILFCAAAYSIGSHVSSAFFSFNITTGAQSFNFWYHWGSASSNVNVYNPRITSDNSIFDGAYLYITVAVDSIRSDGNKNVFQRIGIVFNPFGNSIPITYRNNLSFYWYGTTPNTSSYYLWQDICYYRSQSGQDRVYTVYNIPQYNAIFTAYSNNYGISPAGYFIIYDGLKIDQAHVVSSGGHFNQNIAIAYRVQPNISNNYDFKCMYSTNGGTSIASFTNTYVEGSNSTACRYIDVQAIKLSQGMCKFVYSTSTDMNIYYTGNINFSSYEPTSSIATDPIFGITAYGKLRAGYTNRTTPAGCLVLYNSEFSNQALCVTGFCSQQKITNTPPKNGDIFLENYPNPFNPVTTIKFTVPKGSNVKITVYDILGKEVSTLVNEKYEAGRYNVDFDASSLASGAYFYRVEAGEYSEIKKMILIK